MFESTWCSDCAKFTINSETHLAIFTSDTKFVGDYLGRGRIHIPRNSKRHIVSNTTRFDEFLVKGENMCDVTTVLV